MPVGEPWPWDYWHAPTVDYNDLHGQVRELTEQVKLLIRLLAEERK
jgi:hypothetical protein